MTATLDRIIETALYVDSLERAAAFYEDTLGLKALVKSDALHAYDVGGKSVLLIFRRGAQMRTQALPGGTIPPHDGSGPLHVCFAVATGELAEWEARLTKAGVGIEGRVDWPKGGRSVYFRDPDNHLLELMTPGNWAIY
ncbi:MAG: VOC family protein [Flavobacteriaceae bacterium]